MKAKSPLTLVVDNDEAKSPVQLFVRRERAITVEPNGGTIRILIEPPTPENDHPPYSAVCSYTRLSSTEVMLSGFAGNGFERHHVALIVRWAVSEGYDWLYAERMDSKGLPFGRRRTERPMMGWWEADLKLADEFFNKSRKIA